MSELVAFHKAMWEFGGRRRVVAILHEHGLDDCGLVQQLDAVFGQDDIRWSDVDPLLGQLSDIVEPFLELELNLF